MSLIGISGKIGSGKDLSGKIIQVLTNQSSAFNNVSEITEEVVESKIWDQPKFKIEKFADSLKDMICILLSCTREQLEDTDFKNKELGEQWWYYKLGDNIILPRGYYPSKSDNDLCEERYLVKPTPRMLLQQLGTECGRDILHPNIWVNSLFSKYRAKSLENNPQLNVADYSNSEFPNWIITDMRFPNELEAVKSRGGITIRIERPDVLTNAKTGQSFPIKVHKRNEHPSETALDDAEFDYTIINDSSINDLAHTLSLILEKEKLI